MIYSATKIRKLFAILIAHGILAIDTHSAVRFINLLIFTSGNRYLVSLTTINTTHFVVDV